MTSPQPLSGMLPLWYQVAEGLRATVLERHDSGDTRLPTEAQLAQQYGVSVATVRQALAALAADGLITRHRRRGTHVNVDAPRAHALRVLASTDTVLAQQFGEEVRVLGRSRVPAASAPQLDASGDVVLIQRLRLDEGIPTSYAENWLLPQHARRITKRALVHAPVTKILRDDLAIRLRRIDNALTACAATKAIAARLAIEPNTPVLLSDNVTWSEDGTVVDVAKIWYRADRFTFTLSVELP